MAALLRPRLTKSICFRAVGVKKPNANYADSAAEFAQVARGYWLTEQSLTALRARGWRPHAGLVLATQSLRLRLLQRMSKSTSQHRSDNPS